MRINERLTQEPGVQPASLRGSVFWSISPFMSDTFNNYLGNNLIWPIRNIMGLQDIKDQVDDT